MNTIQLRSLYMSPLRSLISLKGVIDDTGCCQVLCAKRGLPEIGRKRGSTKAHGDLHTKKREDMMNMKKEIAREPGITVLEKQSFLHFLHYRALILPFYPQCPFLNRGFRCLTPSFFRSLRPEHIHYTLNPRVFAK
jgi:hypothetical protein